MIHLLRTIGRDIAITIGGVYLVLCVAVIAGATLAGRFGKDYDRRGDDRD